MLKGAIWLLGFQVIGELASSLLRLPISGAICGMGLLLTFLMAKGQVPEDLTRAADGLLGHMPILFVPVGAGAVVYVDLFQRHWAVVVGGVVGGTLMTLGATAVAARAVGRKRDPGLVGPARTRLLGRLRVPGHG